MDKLGNAVHAYFAVEHKAKAGEERLMLAKRIMKNWDMEDFIEYFEVTDAGKRLSEFLEINYSGCKIFREWPMFMRNDEGQVIQGWIDMLIETREGYVIVDHKDYPGADVIERAEKYKTQLIAYEEAVEKSTGRPVVDILLHFPISGLILKLK
jgi:ATP-dependent exoDNAse (exonuclease V) beta subunit